MLSGQRSLFGGGAPSLDATFARLRRVALDATAWVEHAPEWLGGHEGLMEHLVRTTAWSQPRREMYDRTVDVPRLVAAVPEDGPGHPILDDARRALERRYGVAFPRVSLAYYRDGRDSVAWHGDYVAREMDEALVATVSLGEPRKLLLRPTGGGRSLSFRLGSGDLFVMGGSSQRTWQHAVPKVAHADPRLAVMFRPTWDEGAPPRS
ncbi:MAG TPA: alpha-ketoglutarate-dependent dioxygenase AlkB [Polyangia bacterium]|nr:alpha-ketoglutarate-dependent dioxygenase AlkB [Polyangia bacterium]